MHCPDDLSMLDSLPPAPVALVADINPLITLRRIAATLDLLDYPAPFRW
jgi:hypothetical protein